ncbi:MAG: rod shape-determining protein RodA [Coxiellaceae bacterium]|nr:rod shape-determining protein RodA [Coxiellaceae bacterium]
MTRVRRSLTGFKLSKWHIDLTLLLSLLVLGCIGLLILYSASNMNIAIVTKQAMRFLLALSAMLLIAQIHPRHFLQWAPWFFGITTLLLITVLVVGTVDKGAKRWLDLGILRFQPSELMKIAMPMMLAWYFSDKRLPARTSNIAVACLLLAIPVVLIAKQPDLGTAILVAITGCLVLLLSGISWRLSFSMLGIGILSAPILWHFMHAYQKRRVLTFLNPESDPLGSGYHIIQSKIAIGSGGLLGKGWLHGTQSHLHFLPEHATDFIFAVTSEEFGLLGCLTLMILFSIVLLRCVVISMQAQDTFSRLLSGSLSFTFVFCALINIGMVIGILPVVGVPLPLVSYGGTSMVTMMVGFGMIMSIHTHRKLLAS